MRLPTRVWGLSPHKIFEIDVPVQFWHISMLKGIHHHDNSAPIDPHHTATE